MHRHIFYVSAHCKPIAEAGRDPEIFLTEDAAHFADFEVNEPFHAVVVFPDITVLAEVVIKQLGNDANAVSPAKHGHKAHSLLTGRRWNSRRYVAQLVFILGLATVAKEFCPEFFCIKVVRSRFCKDLTVTGVAHSLVALWAVCGNLNVV